MVQKYGPKTVFPILYRVLEEVGAGQFGTVCKGLWICEGESMLVAVKSLQESASEGERVKFLQEAALMGQFSHPNIIGIHGVVTISTPVREALVHPHKHCPYGICCSNADSDSVGASNYRPP